MSTLQATMRQPLQAHSTTLLPVVLLPSRPAHRPDGEGGDDLGSNNKSIQEGVFATLYTLTKNRAMDTSLRIAALRVVLEFLQVCVCMLCTCMLHGWPGLCCCTHSARVLKCRALLAGSVCV